MLRLGLRVRAVLQLRLGCTVKVEFLGILLSLGLFRLDGVILILGILLWVVFTVKLRVDI